MTQRSLVVLLVIMLGPVSVAAQLPASGAREVSPPAATLELAQSIPPMIELEVPNVGTVSVPLQILILLTFLSFIPAVLVTMTAFTRIVIVFHFLRQALGTQEMPSNQILLGLALFLTMFIMAPVAVQVNTAALQPVVTGEISLGEGVSRAVPPVRDFMLTHTREADLSLFVELSDTASVETKDELPMSVVIPAFVISELKTGFQMGFFLFVPFLLIDLVVSTTLLSMGMMQLPPMMISLPFKVMLFVMIDGWNLLVGSVVRSFF